MSKSEWESRKSDQRTAKNADQAEFLAVKSGSCSLDEGVRDDRTADALDDFGSLDPDQAEFWAVEDSKADDAVGATATEIERRASLMGASYPFVKDGNKLTYRQSRSLAYELCLAIASAPTVVPRPYNALPPAFERLCGDIVTCFLGPNSFSLRTGWPVDGEEERTAKFKSVIDKMHANTSEWIWYPRAGMPPDPSHKDVKDLGIDFAVWKRIPDARRGMLFLLGQCACGDDWTEKFTDLNVQHLEDDWFRFLSVAAPVRVFCIPRHIPNSTFFDEVNRKAGLTLDRARIALLAESETYLAIPSNRNHPSFRDLVRLVFSEFEVERPTISPQPQTTAAAPRSQSPVPSARPSPKRTLGA